MSVIQELLFFAFCQLTLICLPQMVYKWQDNSIQKVLELSESSPKLISWTKEQMPKEWLREKISRLDWALLESKIDPSKTSLIEFLSKRLLRRNNCISAPIQSTQACLKVFWVSVIWPQNWLKFFLLISNLHFQKSWRKSDKKQKRLKMT